MVLLFLLISPLYWIFMLKASDKLFMAVKSVKGRLLCLFAYNKIKNLRDIRKFL